MALPLPLFASGTSDPVGQTQAPGLCPEALLPPEIHPRPPTPYPHCCGGAGDVPGGGPETRLLPEHLPFCLP